MGDLISGIALLAGEGDADPQTRDLAGEIQALLSQGPALLKSQQELTPGYNALRLQSLQDMLSGTPAGTRSVTTQTPTKAWYNIRTGETTTTQPQEFGMGGIGGGYSGIGQNGWTQVPGGGGGGGANEWVQYDTLVPTTTETPTPATRGLLDIYSQDVLPADIAATTARRAGNMADLSTLGPGAVANMKALDPASAALYESLQSDAAAGLAAGDRLTSDQQFNVTNPIRASYASRGFAPGAMEGLEEGVNLFGAGNALGQQRRATAGGVASLGQALYTNPALNWLSPGSTTATDNLFSGAQGSQTPGVLDQLGGYGAGLFGQNTGNMQSSEFWNAQARQKGWENTGKGIESLAMMAMMCWSAREIFGNETDPASGADKWKLFRSWMLRDAPLKLRAWYLANGMNWADRLSRASVETRASVRRWMERRIDHA